MESNGVVSNFETKILCNSVLHNFFYPKFDTSPFDSIWLEISIDWYTKSQGPKKKCIHFTRERIHSCSVDTARNKGSFTTIALWSVKSFNSPTVCIQEKQQQRMNSPKGRFILVWFVKTPLSNSNFSNNLTSSQNFVVFLDFREASWRSNLKQTLENHFSSLPIFEDKLNKKPF